MPSTTTPAKEEGLDFLGKFEIIVKLVVVAGKGGENDFKMMKNLVRISTQDILESYMIGKVIGEGIFGVFLKNIICSLRRADINLLLFVVCSVTS